MDFSLTDEQQMIVKTTREFVINELYPHEKEVEETQKDRNVQLSERSYGVFVRVLQLPPGIDPASVQATMSNGILKLTIPKPAKSEPKKIEVKEAA